MDKIQLFKESTDILLSSNLSIKYKWGEQDKGNIICVKIYKQNENGFDIWWAYYGYVIYYNAGNVHHSELLFNKEASFEVQLKNHLGFLRDLLSDKMRIVEKYAGRTPYKVLIQSWNGQQWQTEDILGILVYNYFGRRTEKYFQNSIIEGYVVNRST